METDRLSGGVRIVDEPRPLFPSCKVSNCVKDGTNITSTQEGMFFWCDEHKPTNLKLMSAQMKASKWGKELT